MPGVMENTAARRWSDAAIFGPARIAWPLRLAAIALASMVLSTLLVFAIEWIVRGSFTDTMQFFRTPHKPAWTTVALFVVVLTASDAIFGRIHYGFIVVGPLALIAATTAREKSLYLGDPLYPSDFLYARQIVDLLPLLVRDRPWSAVGIALLLIASAALMITVTLFWWRRFDPIPWKGRMLRLAFALPLLAWFAVISDYASFSLARDRLRILPIMWDQKENYAHNGFTMAFILNVPMATVFAPEGYSPEAIAAIEPPAQLIPAAFDSSKPDVIMVMSESFWDPTRLPGVAFSADPIPTVRAEQSGHVFSPEFGGMTANVEFEALTGFSKAFLPSGSIPYQQYIRRPLPSLASFFKDQGYATRAIHPYRQWFWNRGPVYESMGFDRFMSEENMPPLEKRGALASDAALTDEIIREADSMDAPFFFFAVSLQGHGPYEANRYPDSKLEVQTDASEHTRQSIRSYSQGAMDADASLARLMEWASKRDRETILVFFGDHLPPLGPVYVETGFMANRVASRTASAEDMMLQHETPLVLWSNKRGAERGTGTISPAFLPLHILDMAGMQHPYYTGFLRQLHERYRVVDNHAVFDRSENAEEGWQQRPPFPPLLRDYQMLQYDMIFGSNFARERFFPSHPEQS
ncbi:MULTISPECIES: LTA synthase family protein [Brucella]|nr:LTA synthase family protein [Ochrobactrum sp. RH1CCR137]KAB2720529.1 LTA synthase family protein [Brucella intermedia]KAB2722360.1 LTA synthase family protein [Brucella intermedia]